MSSPSLRRPRLIVNRLRLTLSLSVAGEPLFRVFSKECDLFFVLSIRDVDKRSQLGRMILRYISNSPRIEADSVQRSARTYGANPAPGRGRKPAIRSVLTKWMADHRWRHVRPFDQPMNTCVPPIECAGSVPP